MKLSNHEINVLHNHIANQILDHKQAIFFVNENSLIDLNGNREIQWSCGNI